MYRLGGCFTTGAVRLFIVLAVLIIPLSAQSTLDSYLIDTYAGSDPVRDGGPAAQALLNGPEDVAIDAQGVVYIADRLNRLIRRVDPDTGIISTIAGSVEEPRASDVATELEIDPACVAVSPANAVHFCSNRRVYKILPSGKLQVVAGTGSTGGTGDGGLATEATFGIIADLAFAPDGSLYISDSFEHVVRKVSPAGMIERVAGTGERGFTGDGGPATSAQLSTPNGLAVDAEGRLLVVDRGNLRLRRVAVDGTITTATGDGTFVAKGLGGPAEGGSAGQLLAVAVAGDGSIYATSFSEIFLIDGQGILTRFGGAGSVNIGDGRTVDRASFQGLNGIAVAADGRILLAERIGHRVRLVGADLIVSTFAGAAHFVGDGGPAVQAQLFEPNGVALDAEGSLYVADTKNGAVRKVTADGVITTVAGGRTSGSDGDAGPALDATLRSVQHIAFHPNGDLHLVDSSYRTVRRVDSNGVISTVAGGGSGTVEGGPATDARLNGPFHISFDQQGNLYIADLYDHSVRVVDTNGTIRTLAGTGTRGFSGDGGPAAQAELHTPSATAVGPDGTVYIAEWLRIRQVKPDGTISTLAELTVVPSSLTLTPSGDLLAVNTQNNMLLRIGLDGSVFRMGRLLRGFKGDGGPADAAFANSVEDAVEHSDGRIFISDRRNSRIRVLTPLPTISGLKHAASFFTGSMPAEAIVSIFGQNLASGLVVATTVPLPTTLGGTTVVLRDADGVERPAGLFFVSTHQLNVLLPAGAAPGLGVLIIRTAGGREVQIDQGISVASPGLFSANATGAGVAAGFWLRVAGDGTQTTGPLFEFNADQTKLVEKPLDLGPESDKVYLILYGTGIRGVAGAANVGASVGGRGTPVVYADAHAEFAGLDQVNVGPISRELIGRGLISIQVVAASKSSNSVTAFIQ
jgi:uncharacterized protein (TIGR03437 family)